MELLPPCFFAKADLALFKQVKDTWRPADYPERISFLCFRPFNDIDIILFATFIGVFLIFGLIFNLTTIAVIASSKKLR